MAHIKNEITPSVFQGVLYYGNAKAAILLAVLIFAETRSPVAANALVGIKGIINAASLFAKVFKIPLWKNDFRGGLAVKIASK